VAHLGGNTFLVLLAVAVGLPLALAVTLRRRSPGRTSRRVHVLRAANLVVFCGLLAATVLPGTYDLLAVYGPAKATTIRIAVVVAAAIAAVLAVVPGRRIMPAMQGLVAIASVFLAVELAAAYRLPPNAVTMSAPFAGEWYVAQGGHAELVNGHRSNPSQHEALDIFAVQGGSTHRAGDTSLDAYYAYGEPLLAPADGEVVYVSDGLADRPAGSPDPDPAHAEGNQMIIDIGGGRFLYLAHLQRHSALVMAGDTVRDGQALARVGNSGNSDEPHLHIQVQDSAARDIHHSGVHTYPILFRNVTLVRDGAVTHPARADLRRGDRFRATTR